METHDSDPTSAQRSDPWETVSGEFGRLRERLEDTYREVARGHGPSDDEIKEAFSTLLAAWDRVAESLSLALKDTETRDRIKRAASSLAMALGATISEVGSELGRAEGWGVDSASPEEE